MSSLLLLLPWVLMMLGDMRPKNPPLSRAALGGGSCGRSSVIINCGLVRDQIAKIDWLDRPTILFVEVS